jgi:hypothetical protein
VTETTEARLSVIVLARPRPGDELRDTLGGARADALAQLQVARAQAWVSACLPAEKVALRSGGLSDVIRDPGPIAADDVLFVVSPEIATWRPDLARAALDDLRTGCALTIGPIFDGGLYLLAATGAGLQLLRDGGDGAGTGAADLTGPGAMATLVALAERAGIEVGLLRTERGLRSAGDVRALLADPLTDGELRSRLDADWGEGT